MDDANLDEAVEIAHNALFANRSFNVILNTFEYFINSFINLDL